MIRHSSSFLISLILHLAFIFIVFSVYKIMDNTTKKEEEKKLKIMLCSLPSPKPVMQKKPIQEPTKTLPKKKELKPIEPVIKKEGNKNPKNEAKQFIPEDKPEALKPKEPIKKPKKPKEPVTKPIKPEIKQTIPKEPEELQEEKTEPIEHLKEEPLESIQEKESRLAQEYINENIKKISKLLSENLYYPISARKRNIQGKVMVKFKLSRSAKAYDIEVTSSQNEILSRSAIRTIENLSEKFPSPNEELILHVPITYKLNR